MGIINNDLNNIQPNAHNIVGHTFLTFILCLIFNPIISGVIMYLYEIIQGFMPSYNKAPDNWFMKLFYSDKISLQDVFIWNPLGLVLGILVILIFKL